MKSTASYYSRTIAAFALALIAAAALTVLASGAQAQVSQDLKSLGSNKDVNKRAASLESRSRVAIVQNRTVKRDWRPEIGVQYAPVAFGDSYLQTQNLGLNADLHISPKFSLGVRYSKAYTNFTNEGRAQYQAAQDAANAGKKLDIPGVDVPQETILGVVNWYMTYGKINFFDTSVVQFDIYALAGGGQVTLKNAGNVGTWTAGGGVGFWLNQHLTSRFELRYQNYSDKVGSGTRNLDLVVAGFGLGLLI